MEDAAVAITFSARTLGRHEKSKIPKEVRRRERAAAVCKRPTERKVLRKPAKSARIDVRSSVA